jgi:hypothetical protein
LPRFFYQLSGGRDDLGPSETVLPDVGAARRVAVRFLAQSLLDRAEGFWDQPDWEVIVSDEDQLTLFTLRVLGTDAPAAVVAVPVAPEAPIPE